MGKVWFHIDMDAFFASVEQLDHPELRGQPVIVGGSPGHRGVVSTCSYEARVFGVRSGMPTDEAYALCPQGHFVFPHMHRYQEISETIMHIFQRFTPELLQVSVDEAFLNMTGTQKLLGSPETVVEKIKHAVRDEVGLTLSVGVAATKYIAKIASGVKKPDGLTIIPEGHESDFMATLPLDKLWGVGKKGQERLRSLSITTMAALRALPIQVLRAGFGNASAEFIRRASHGLDPGIYEGEATNHSISSETTFEIDVTDIEVLKRTLFDLCNQVVFRLLREAAESKVIFIKIRYSDFSSYTVRMKAGHNLSSIEECFALAQQLLLKKLEHERPVRLIGIGFDEVHAYGDSQLDLFENPEEKRAKVEQTVLGIRERFPDGVISKASLLVDRDPQRRQFPTTRNEKPKSDNGP